MWIWRGGMLLECALFSGKRVWCCDTRGAMQAGIAPLARLCVVDGGRQV